MELEWKEFSICLNINGIFYLLTLVGILGMSCKCIMLHQEVTKASSKPSAGAGTRFTLCHFEG